MSFLPDTNILLYLSIDSAVQKKSEVIASDGKKKFASVATVGELKSIAIQNNRGHRRLQNLNDVTANVIIIEVNENLVELYGEIDAFSQRKNPSYTEYPFTTSRNMGNNDLWIAATAALLVLKLITTDTDFNHLNGVFFEVQCLKPEVLLK